jgi:Zn-dependent M28 family amino/carboxypeptidase
MPMPAIDAAQILERTRALSADEFEGRAPGTKGEELTVKYLEDEFRKLGLQPGNSDGTFVQNVPLVGITGTNAQPLTITKGAQKATFKWSDEVVAWSKHVAPAASIKDSEVIFAGYGVTAPEFNWDDFKDVDVKGKTIIVLVNDPQVPDPADPSKLDQKLFNGAAMTYYGRWTYKYEEGARRGAAGILIVHETGPAGYPFSVVQGNLREKFDLVTPDKNRGRSAIEGWVTLDAAKRILKMGGQDFDALKKQALTPEFKPVPLGLRASLAMRNTMRTLDSRNVLAKVEGADPEGRNEYVVYTAHWDHLGVGAPVNGDRIYNGALDNGVGVAEVLGIATAFKALPQPPRRSVLFLFVAAEEQGTLGSEYYAKHPTFPPGRIAANINIDEGNVWGKATDVIYVGKGKSTLDPIIERYAQFQGRIVKPDQFPDRGYFYRSDQIAFARLGVPAFYQHMSTDFRSRPPGWGKEQVEGFEANRYHQPSDEVGPDWNYDGLLEDLQLAFYVGLDVANADRMPEWTPGDEFEAARKAALAALGE